MLLLSFIVCYCAVTLFWQSDVFWWGTWKCGLLHDYNSVYKITEKPDVYWSQLFSIFKVLLKDSLPQSITAVPHKACKLIILDVSCEIEDCRVCLHSKDIMFNIQRLEQTKLKHRSHRSFPCALISGSSRTVSCSHETTTYSVTLEATLVGTVNFWLCFPSKVQF